MPIYYNQSATKDVTLRSDADLPEDQRAVFTLRPPRIRDRDKLQAKVMSAQVEGKDGEMETDAAAMFASGLMTDALLATLTGWTNWRDPEGNDVECKRTSRGLVTEESLGALVSADQLELAVHAIGMITVGGAESD